jgi:hypothetical protein
MAVSVYREWRSTGKFDGKMGSDLKICLSTGASAKVDGPTLGFTKAEQTE